MYRREKAIRCTASSCKTPLGLRKESAKIRYLRSNVWFLDKFSTWATRYGIENEPRARQAYLTKMKEKDEDATVIECGLWINPKYPQLGCSPDGILRSPLLGRILLEIKCLTLTHINPEFFEDMSDDKLRRFYLKRLENGSITLKKTDKYYYQVQMSLDVLELPLAHFFVWSEAGSVVCEIPRDKSFFKEKRLRLIEFHRTIVLQEFFLRRTVRRLPPVQVNYADFHEDENDNYFSQMGSNGDPSA